MSEALPRRATIGGRVVFDTFRSVYDPMLDSWLVFRAQILPDVSATPPDIIAAGSDRERSRAGRYGVWRILATNNRELGRGTGLFATPTDAMQTVTALQRDAPLLAAAVVRGSAPMTHGWVLRREGEPVMTSSRWYESASEAATAARTARAVLGVATIANGVNIGTQSGRRLRREIVPVNPIV
ncbi:MULTISPECIES: hypothetical protein [unclassified Microbacterium]|uniref:hypothetical protein n=1 Tax=unclassified Microbacterium TaxID=2609290 RepID=UPI00374728CA